MHCVILGNSSYKLTLKDVQFLLDVWFILLQTWGSIPITELELIFESQLELELILGGIGIDFCWNWN